MKSKQEKREAIEVLARQLMANSLTSQRDMMSAKTAVKTAIQIYESVESVIKVTVELY